MFTLRDLLFGVGLPALVAGVVFCIAWRPWPPGSPIVVRNWAAPVSLGAGFGAGFLGIVGWPGVPPVESNDWLLLFSVLLTIFGFLDSVTRPPSWVRWLHAVTDFALVVCLLLWPVIRNSWSPSEAIVQIFTLLVLLGFTWVLLELLAAAPGGSLALELSCVTSLAGLTLMLSASQKLGQIGGVLASALGGYTCVAWWAGSRLGREAIAGFVVLFDGLLICGHSFAQLTALNAVLLSAAPLAALVRRTPFAQRLAGWQQTLLGLFAVLVPAGTAAVLAAIEFARSVSAYEY